MKNKISKNIMREVSEIRDGMIIDWDIPITMDDGVILRSDIYRPIKTGIYPVILSYGPYAKWLGFQEGYSTAWETMVEHNPDVLKGSSNKYQSWEVVDPEKWVSDGYVCVRVDSRGAGRSPGYIDHFSPRETLDIYHCIEWAAIQNWSNGKIGMNGVSYYAINAWQVAGLQPPHLSAICVWEGAGDWYRDKNHQGGILSTFQANWYDMQVKTVQHGLGENGPISRINGDFVCGPETMTEEDLQKFRCNFGEEIFSHPFDDDYHRDRSANWDKITVPLLSAGNWGGNGLHLRGNVEGFIRSASKNKWLELHGDRHWTLFYTDYGIDLQKRFFGYFLKGEDTGWNNQPPVILQVRYPGEKFILREENEWPLARTNWTKFYLDFENMSLSQNSNFSINSVSYDAADDGLIFRSQPLKEQIEITGPSAAKLFISSNTIDADIFLVIQLFDETGKEIVFQGALDPHTPIAQGWLRASHRELDEKLSLPYRPYHKHKRKQNLIPGEIVELDIEIWPTCIVIPKGYTFGLQIRGKDYVHIGASGGRLSNMKNEFTGCGPFLHDDARDRIPDIFNNTVNVYNNKDQQSYVLLPIIPSKKESLSNE